MGDSLALFQRLARLEELLHDVLKAVTPKPKAKPQKHDPDVLAALAALAKHTGVPTKPADRVELQRAIGLHGKAAMLSALTACDVRIDSRAPQFANRNFIAAAAARCAQQPRLKAVETWRPPSEER